MPEIKINIKALDADSFIKYLKEQFMKDELIKWFEEEYELMSVTFDDTGITKIEKNKGEGNMTFIEGIDYRDLQLLKEIEQFMNKHFRHVRKTKKGTHFHARCVLCGDSKISLSKKRFHLDFNNGDPIWQCFNCEESGTYGELVLRLV